jgi:hypothetical protein
MVSFSIARGVLQKAFFYGETTASVLAAELVERRWVGDRGDNASTRNSYSIRMHPPGVVIEDQINAFWTCVSYLHINKHTSTS